MQGTPEEIVKEKAKAAAELIKKPCFVEDISLCFTALNDLPGPYIKDFIEKLGQKGLVKVLSAFEDKSAKAVCMIGFCKPGEEPISFEGITKGMVVEPRGNRFKWDPIFQPEGYTQTYAEMPQEEKNKISHRKKALEKFKEYLDKND